MESKEFVHLRKKLNKTQTQMAQLLGTSVKAIHSDEQGRRRSPPHAERQIFFLVAIKGESRRQKPCWVGKKFQLSRKSSVRPGSSRQAGSAGLLVGPYVTALFKRIGTKE